MLTCMNTCRHCGEEIERDADGVWVDVRFGEDEEPEYCAMSQYGSHLPEKLDPAD